MSSDGSSGGSSKEGPFKTLTEPCEYEEVIKKSRFLARASPASTIAEAQTFLKSVEDIKASHNCWAFRGVSEERCSDDGEPGGTAGRPILGAIEAEGLKDVVVVVTRYFGGIKLGTGGLVRAYSGVTRSCLSLGPTATRSPRVQVRVTAPLSMMGTVYNAMATSKADKVDEEYEEDQVVVTVSLDSTAVAAFQRQLQDATRGVAQVTVLS